MDKALEKDRELRYQSMAELRSDLKRFRRDSESESAPTVRLHKRLAWMRRGIPITATIVLSAACLALPFIILRNERTPTTPAWQQLFSLQTPQFTRLFLQMVECWLLSAARRKLSLATVMYM